MGKVLRWGYLYETTNLLNGVKYIGVRRSRSGRFNPAYFGSGIHLKRALIKYGAENFRVRCLAWASSMGELGQMEKAAISRHRAAHGRASLYNISEGGYPWGGGMNGVSVRHSPESVARVAAFHRGRKRSLATRRRISEAKKGRPISEAQKQKISIFMKGRAKTQSHRERIAAALRGVPLTASRKAKISAARQGWVCSPEHREAIRLGGLRRWARQRLLADLL